MLDPGLSTGTCHLPAGACRDEHGVCVTDADFPPAITCRSELISVGGSDLDEHETDTGVYVSPTDTGSDPLNPDTDGDGFEDGVEVLAGSDPNDAGSIPGGSVPIPALPVW